MCCPEQVRRIAEEARELARRVEFVYTPVHGSWLNMVEIEISALVRQCLQKQTLGRRRDVGSGGEGVGDTEEPAGDERGVALHDRGRARQASQPLSITRCMTED